MTDRIIVLIDMDCFYCQVEAKYDPTLIGQPVVVVQYNEWRGGGVIAVNYEAREFGISRSMRGDDALEKCKSVRIVKVPEVRGKADLSKYREGGKEVLSVISEFDSRFIIERASIDEAYIDITSVVDDFTNEVTMEDLPNSKVVGHESTSKWLSQVYAGNNSDDRRLAVGALLVERVRKAIYEKTGFRCSAGIAHNKILAKIVCGINKPNKQTVLPHDSVKVLYSNLKLTKLRGLGGKFGEQVVSTLDIETAGQLSQHSLAELRSRFGEKTGEWLYDLGRGFDYEPVKERDLPRSIGCSKTFRGANALDTKDKVQYWVRQLSEEISERLIKDKNEHGRIARTFSIGITTKENGNLTRATPLQSYDVDKISKQAMSLLSKLNSAADDSPAWKPKIIILSMNTNKFEEATKNTIKIQSFFKTFKVDEDEEEKEPMNRDDQTSLEKETKADDISPSFHYKKSGKKKVQNYFKICEPTIDVPPPESTKSTSITPPPDTSDTITTVIEDEECPKCKSHISPFHMPEHLDFHVAQELQRQLRKEDSEQQMAVKRKIKNIDKGTKKQRNISSFFK